MRTRIWYISGHTYYVHKKVEYSFTETLNTTSNANYKVDSTNKLSHTNCYMGGGTVR